HVLRRRASKLDGGRANLDRAGRAVRQEHGLGRNLLGKSQSVRGIRPGWLEPGAVTARQRACHRLGGRREWPKYRALLWEVVHPAGKTADNPLPGKPVEGNVHRLAAADVQEIGWDEDRPAPTTANGRNNPGINGLW